MENHYKIVNLSKGEYIESMDLGCVDTLMGFCTQDSKVTQVLQVLLYDKWAGDCVVVLGEQAFSENADFELFTSDENWYDFIRGFEEDSDWLDLTDRESLYEYIQKGPAVFGERFKNISSEAQLYEDAIGMDPAFIVKHNRKEFVDLLKPEITQVGIYEKKISPLILLLTAGNGRGPGDYYGPGMEYVGMWLDFYSSELDMKYCESQTEKDQLRDYFILQGYKELEPGFRY